ncbi:SusD/RagB family nutrient-binding outer membrane lipoprotein, partial [Flavobacterium sp.]|uniref:SusD/RagB family nutrient-binding outer membrane lipoprotein n=1 Tax=Flavobacterium sp. TaxID=239 RepID=UPI002624EDC1
PWVQYSAQRNYTEEDRFQFRQETNTALFNAYYIAANNYKLIIDLNVDAKTSNAMAAYGNTKNQIAAGRIMLAYCFMNLADAYGDIPYYSYGSSDTDFQALQLDKNILQPKYASQVKVYTDIMKELKEAAEMINLNEKVFFKGDALFAGDPLKMKKFANSLRLRVATRVKNAIPAASAHIADAIASGVMTSNADNVGVQYENNTVNPSPFYSDHFVSNRTDFAISNTFVELLKGDRGVFGVDPRLQKYAAPITASKTAVRDKTYTETSDLTKYVGMPYGITSAQAASQRPGTSYFSSQVLSANYKEIMMEYSEVCFLLSENANWDVTFYKKGVEASMKKWGVAQNLIDAYLSSLPGANAENVATQKYIALYMQPYEAWSEYRRTGFPSTLLKPGQKHVSNGVLPDGSTEYTFVALNGLSDLPTRFTYPVNSAQLNSENYSNAATAMGGDKLTSKLIWDKN